jgi:parallel beta-helix repeat protein
MVLLIIHGPRGSGGPLTQSQHGPGISQLASYTSHDPIVITSDTNFTDQGWPGSGTEEDPYVISGLNITSNDTAISISQTTVYFVIRDCFISSPSTTAESGIVFHLVRHGAVEVCIISHRAIGIDLASCSDFIITNNTVTHCSTGISAWGVKQCAIGENALMENDADGLFLTDCSDCIVFGNTAAANGGTGFVLRYAIGLYLKDNMASNNIQHGFDLSYSLGFGFEMLLSENCTLQNNTATANVEDAFVLISVRNCTLIRNTASYNRCGVYLLGGASGSLVYLNTLFNNTANGYDDGAMNRWDNGTHGNYWGDYDGVGDYEVPGAAQSVDKHPVLYDLLDPEIEDQGDIEYEADTIGHFITWRVSDLHPGSYELYQNGTLIDSGAWETSTISINIDGLEVGTYSYTLLVRDLAGNVASDTVMVIVRPSSSHDIPILSSVSLLLTLVGTSIAVIFSVLIVLHRLGYRSTSAVSDYPIQDNDATRCL